MAFELRPYQSDAIKAVTKKWENEHEHEALIVIPTGGGKTVIFCQITQDELNKGGRVLILAHRNKLLEQAQDKLSKFGILSDIEKGQKKSDSQVVISTVQTYSRKERLDLCPPDTYSLIIIDECHHAASRTYQTILDHFTGAKLLGVTATPERSDRKDIEQVFGHPVFQYYFLDAIEAGFLTPIVVRQASLSIDLSNVDKSCGDYAASSLGNCLECYLDAIAKEILSITHERNKILIFLPLVSLAQKMTDTLKEKGIPCEYVSGDRKESDDILEDFENGKYQVVCNAMLLTEGYDCPSIDCIINLRPTRSSSLYTQIVGRGTRLFPGKENVLLVDFLWQDDGKGVLRSDELLLKERYEFLAETEEEKGILKEVLEKEIGKDEELFKVGRDTEAAFVNALAEARWKKAEAKRQKFQDEHPLGTIKYNYPYQEFNEGKTRFYYDPNEVDENNHFRLLGMELKHNAAIAFKCSEYTISRHEFGPTEKQIERIKKLDSGFPTECVYYKDQASMIIDILGKRNNGFGERKASFKQTDLLEDKGFRGIQKLRAHEAAELITMLKANKYIPNAEMYQKAEVLTKTKQQTAINSINSTNSQLPELW